jgi:hypothetical protein
MLEFLILIPNLTAQFMVTLDKAFHSNVLFCLGNLIMIYHNYQIGDVQIWYFILLEVMSVLGVALHIHRSRKKKIEESKVDSEFIQVDEQAQAIV